MKKWMCRAEVSLSLDPETATVMSTSITKRKAQSSRIWLCFKTGLNITLSFGF